MRRLFLSLYIALAGAFLFSVLAVPWLITQSLRNPLVNYSGQLAAVPQLLFESELSRLPQEQWPAHVAELQQQFGYELQLLRLDELQVDAQTLRLVRSGQGTSPSNERNDLDVMLLPIRGSDYVIKTGFAESEAEKAQRSLGGIFYLAERYLAQLAPESRAATLAKLSQQYRIPLNLIATEQTGLTHAQLTLLNQHQVVGLNLNSSGPEQYFKLLADNSAVLKIGPLPEPWFARLVTPGIYAAIAAVLALIAFLWIRPLWRDLRGLDQGAAQFGAGLLNARVHLKQGSAIKPLAETFNDMAGQIQSLIDMQRELTQAVSHELRTPLARLRFTVDMLATTQSTEDRARYINGMRTDIGELEALVDESLSYARLTSPHGVKLEPESVQVVEWLTGIVTANRHVSAPIKLDLETALITPLHIFDRRLLARAMQNLVRNAMQYANSRVLISVTDQPGHLNISVDDDGPGVPNDQRELIFHPFHRVDNSRSRDTGGYGLGLAIAKRICELHQAQLTVTESPSGGARFVIQLGSKE